MVESEKQISALQWFLLCIIVFLVSIFIHECGHGLANSIAGIDCSTGFNRVGDIYKYPSQEDFRAVYSTESDVLFDFGVPATLLLAIIGTVLGCRLKNRIAKTISLAVAATNSMMRLIPCLFVVLVPLITGNIHEEDEYGTGCVLAEATRLDFLTYVPAVVSIIISVACILALFLVLRKKYGTRMLVAYELWTLVSFYIVMIIANALDNLVRINWVAMK